MGYEMSLKVINKIYRIPNFKIDIGKIKNLSLVKSKYGIDPDERILSYRVVPKLLAKLETGGVIFTDRGVYKKLPSGYLASDYVTYGIKYEDMVDYIPWLGYSADRQPQLIGEHAGKRNLSFWMTPVVGTESNAETISVFRTIIKEVVAQDDALKQRYKATKSMFLKVQKEKCERDGSFPLIDESVLKGLIEDGEYEDGEREEAFVLVFKNKFVCGDYSGAYSFVENNSRLMEDAVFVDRINPVIENKISEIGVPETYENVEALKLYCVKNDKFIPDMFSNIVSFYFGKNSYDSVDEFVGQFSGNTHYDYMKDVLAGKIREKLTESIQRWNKGDMQTAFVLSGEEAAELQEAENNDEKFITYAMRKPEFYKEASMELVKHYCALGDFNTARKKLEKVREVEGNVSYLEELEKFIREYMPVYAANQYQKAQGYIVSNDKQSAIVCLQKAVECDNENYEYMLELISLEIELKKFSAAQSSIKKIIARGINFDDKNIERFRQLQVDCADGITREMCVLYDMIVNNDADSLANDSKALAKEDQLGMNFYYYAILLKRDDVVGRIDISKTSVMKDICNYPITCFACASEEPDSTFIQLLMLYDQDGKKLYKDYKRNEREKGVLGIVQGAFGAFFGVASGQMDDKESEIFSEKSGEVEERVNNIVESVDKKWVNKMKELAHEKIVIAANKLDENVDDNNLKSRIIYMIIKNPELLGDIFHGDRSRFMLYQENGDFWYLPESLLRDAKKLKVRYVPREVPSLSLDDYEDTEDEEGCDKFKEMIMEALYKIGCY